MSSSKNSSWKSVLLRHETILFFVLAAEWIFFDSIGRNFGTLDNSFDILRHSCEIGLLAVAMTPVILTGGIDLSVGSLLGLCAILFGKLWRDAQLPIWAAALSTLGIGAIAGSLNAVLITWLRLPALIVTLGTYSLFRGLAEAITHGVDTFTDFPGSFLFLGQERWLGIPAQAPVFILVTIFFWLLVHRTAFGRSFRAIGFSPEGARYAGIPVARRVSMTYVLAGIVSAIAAIVYVARIGQAKADAGTDYELLAITAVVLGGTSIFGGIGSVHGTILGVAAIAVLESGMVHALEPRELARMFTGVLLILALTSSVAPKLISALRARKSAPKLPKQYSTTA
ncbi:MAG TPA: ABC transporter permease [Verrucomicrobiae bacterium]|nr:ABC transporter permease [Verrucomicrobiae bacterium]